MDKDVPLVSDGNNCYPSVDRDLGTSNEVVALSSGERVREDLRIQTVSNRHGRLKWFLSRHGGAATKCLDNYLRRLHLIVLGQNPNSRTVLNAVTPR